MQLITVMRHFTIRFRMLGATASVALALIFIGTIGVAAQLYANSIATHLVTRDITSLTELARCCKPPNAPNGRKWWWAMQQFRTGFASMAKQWEGLAFPCAQVVWRIAGATGSVGAQVVSTINDISVSSNLWLKRCQHRLACRCERVLISTTTRKPASHLSR